MVPAVNDFGDAKRSLVIGDRHMDDILSAQCRTQLAAISRQYQSAATRAFFFIANAPRLIEFTVAVFARICRVEKKPHGAAPRRFSNSV
jgi:hypothetical protein